MQSKYFKVYSDTTVQLVIHIYGTARNTKFGNLIAAKSANNLAKLYDSICPISGKKLHNMRKKTQTIS